MFGESNNLELGLHVLHFYDGDFDKSIKAILNDSIELEEDNPILTYKYNETEVWSKEEVKLFEESILKYDKNFSDIAAEMKTKTTKQCIEFYYFWKKVMSDHMKKKWRSLKKNRYAEPANIHQNLRSSNKGEQTQSQGTAGSAVKPASFKDKTNNFKIESKKRLKIKCPDCGLVSLQD